MALPSSTIDWQMTDGATGLLRNSLGRFWNKTGPFFMGVNRIPWEWEYIYIYIYVYMQYIYIIYIYIYISHIYIYIYMFGNLLEIKDIYIGYT